MSDHHILFEKHGHVGRVVLNRPSALNSLNLEMYVALARQLQAWKYDEEVKAIVIQGAGEKAFCAGGDVKRMYEDLRWSRTYFRTSSRYESYCIGLLRAYPKPVVPLMDGIVMGAGVGISVHGACRVVTENTVLAMPETSIGWFPDASATYFLPRLRGQLGLLLGLTGQRLSGAECVAARLADFFVPRDRLEQLGRYLAATSDMSRVTSIVASLGEQVSEESVSIESDRIDRHFGLTSVEEILQSLWVDDSKWARAVAESLRRKSPLSLKVTMKQLRLGTNLSFDDALSLEWRIANRLTTASDFHEGVRALLIDKDMKPHWQPPSLAEVTEADVATYFAPMTGDELDLRELPSP